MADPCMDPGASFHSGDELFRLLVESVNDYAIFLLDPQGRVASWNAGAERLNGYRREEILGQHFARFNTAEDVRAGQCEQALAAATADGQHEHEGWRVRKDGTRFWASVVLTALRDAHGNLRGFATVTHDLTAQKRAEHSLACQAAALREQAEHLQHSQEMLHQLQQDLERRVDERTAALKIEIVERQRAEKALQEEGARKDQFLAMLAHELRNPLAPIRTALEILRMPHAPRGVIQRAHETMERQVSHMARIVDDLLDVARIASGRIMLRPERLDLVRLVRQSAEDRRPAIERAGLTLTVDLPELPVWVRGEPLRLTQVIDNLLDNATKFTPRGGRVALSLERDLARGQAVLTVSDTGTGIEAKILPRLFDPLCQADTSLERAKGGLGLGLALVKGLAELQGGSVEALSAGLGKGSQFTVRLPAEPEPAAVRGMLEYPAPAGRPLRILVVEDNPDAAEMLRALLALSGHQVEMARTGPEGVHAARMNRPEVLLCDIGLPGLDGYGVVRELRRDPVTAHTYAIAVTGYGSDEDRRRSSEAGFDQHLVKPVDIDILEKLLNRLGDSLGTT